MATTLSHKNKTSSPDVTARRRIAFGVGSGLALVAIAAAIYFWWPKGRDPQVERMLTLANQLRGDQESALPEADRERLRGEMRTMGEGLTEAQRREFGQAMFDSRRAEFTQRIDDYFALPEDQRNAYLDDQIQQFEEMRKRWQANADRSGDGRGGRGGRGGWGGPWGGGGRGPGGDRENRDSWRRAMLDRTSPEERAKFMAYMEAVNERRKELGLPPMGPPGRPGGPGGPGGPPRGGRP